MQDDLTKEVKRSEWMPKTRRTKIAKFIGFKGKAEIVRIFAAVTNIDLNEGRGENIDDAYYFIERDALVGAIGIGVMGGDGEVEERFAVRFDNGTYFLLADPGLAAARPSDDAPLVSVIVVKKLK